MSVRDPWHELASGRLEAARRGFQAQESVAASSSLRGLLALAQLQSDADAAARLLPLVRVTDPPDLVLTAAACALSFSPVPTVAKKLARWACALQDEPEYEVEARAICARIALWGERTSRARYLAGQEQTHAFPLELWGSQPVVWASIDDGAPLPFLVDTGASLSVVTRAAALRLGVRAVEGTDYRVDSPGGLIETHLARVRLTLGALQLDDLEVALVDLPLPGIAGILSPQTAFLDLTVELDFRAFTLRVGRRLEPRADDVTVALVLADGRPFVVGALTDLPERYFLLDTGADATRIQRSYAVGRDDLAAHEGGHYLAAGKLSARTWALDGRHTLRTAGIAWELENATLIEDDPARALVNFWSAGTLGMDFLMGRTLTLDMARHALHLSQARALPPWPDDATATFELSGSAVPDRVLIHERVVRHEHDDVILEVTLERGRDTSIFRLRSADTFANRAGFMLTRPVSAGWEHNEGRFADTTPARIEALWSTVFFPFKVLPSPPETHLVRATLAEKALSATATSVAVDTPAGPATLRVLSAAAEPWRTLSVELTSVQGKTLWSYRRQGLAL